MTVAPVGRRGRFRAEFAGRTIVESSKQPFLDGARVLISEGYAPNIILEMWHINAITFALRSTIGRAAKLTVKESTRDSKPRFSDWHPYGGPGVRVASLISETEPAGVDHCPNTPALPSAGGTQ